MKKKKYKTTLVHTVMSYSPSQSLENLGFGVLRTSCGCTVRVLELQEEQKEEHCSNITVNLSYLSVPIKYHIHFYKNFLQFSMSILAE
jgi:hypothetical protein